MYLYRTTIWKDPVSLNLPASDITQHQNNKADFETSYKTSAKKVAALYLGELVFEIERTYQEFKTQIVNNIDRTWTDAKYQEKDDRYNIYFASNLSL